MTRSPARIDCGEHGSLTIAEIAQRVGVGETAIHMRIQAGVHGAALLKPRGQGPRPGYRTNPSTARPHRKRVPQEPADKGEEAAAAVVTPRAEPELEACPIAFGVRVHPRGKAA